MKEQDYMEIYTLETDFSSLNGPQASNWMLGFSEMTETAFADSDNRSRLLGNLLIIEQCVHTLCQGLAANDEQPSAALQEALDLCWDWLEERITPTDFQDFANNLYASMLSYNVGENLTDAQKEFYSEYFSETEPNNYEWQILTWVAQLLIQLVASVGGRVDFDECKEDEQFGSVIGIGCGIDEMLTFLGDACIEFTNTPCLSNKAKDLLIAMEQVYQTPLFRQIIDQIRKSLKTALITTPEQYSALRKEYQQYTIIPEEYAANLMEF